MYVSRVCALFGSAGRRPWSLSLSLLLALSAACDVFDAELEQRIASQQGTAPECQTHADCGGGGRSLAACVEPEGKCMAVNSSDCTLGAGDLEGDAIVLGSLFATTGPQAATNLARQQATLFAVEEINAVGGVPGPGMTRRHLALVACNAANDVRRAARHLVNELKVPAIVGPNTSQDTLAITNEISARGGTLLLTPTAVASSIVDLSDSDLTWMMVPSDEQRAPLMRQQINELEAALRRERARDTIRLSVIYRDDALGMGTRVGLNALTLNGATLVQNQASSVGAVTIEPYDSKLTDQRALVQRQAQFAPDIVVLGGLAEAIDTIMMPLEEAWGDGPQPYYILIDSLRGPELLQAVLGDDGLRKRVRGTGIVPTLRSAPVHDAFRLGFQAKYPGMPATVTGMGPSYDAPHALAYALAATRALPVSGASIAQGLRALSGGPEIEVESTKVLAAFRELSDGRPITAIGTFAPFSWDARGAPQGGSVEVWCIAGGATPSYAGSGLTFDLATAQRMGEYRPCE